MTIMDILYPKSQAMEVFKKQREHPLSYLCKICSKRFVSGRALGGHMRAHVPASMAADTVAETEFRKTKRPRTSDDKSMEEKEDEEGLDGNGTNLMFALGRNSKRSWRFADRDSSLLLGYGFDSKPIDSSINCDLCGKEFSSWKDLFGHMICHYETHQDSGDAHLEESQKHETQETQDQDSCDAHFEESQKHETHDQEEHRSDSDDEIEIDHPSGNSSRFDKGKRSKRPGYAIKLINPHEQFGLETNNEEEDMAMCLVMLASGANTAQNPQSQVGAEEPGSGDLKLSSTGCQLPKCIRKKLKSNKIDGDAVLYDGDEVKKARYKCITCNKVFHSHQALGGHRASHNKVKGSVSQIEKENESLEEDITDEELIPGSDSQLPRNFCKPHPKERTKDSCVKARTIETAAFSGKKSRIHECSICHRVFASGQALGGHKRCHWVSAGASDSITTSSSNKETPVQQQQMPARVELLDLNLPAPVDDDCDAGNLNNLGSSAVDSHGASDAQTHSPPCSQSWLMGMSYPKLGLFLSNNYSHISKSDEADGKVRKEIGFGRGCDSEIPVRAQSWLQL